MLTFRGLRGEGIVDWDLVRLVEERARREATSGQRRRARKVLELAVALVAQRCPKTSLEVLELVEVEQLDERLKWKRALTAAEAHLGAGEAASALVELNSVARPLPDARSEAVLRWVDALCLSLLGRYADAEARLAEINGGSARPGQLLMRAHQAVLANDEPKALAELEQVGPALLATWFTEGCVLVQGPAEPLARTVAAR